MSTLNEIKKREIETFESSMKLRNIPFDKNCKKYRTDKIRTQQEDMWKRNKFYKGLLKHWKEVKNEED